MKLRWPHGLAAVALLLGAVAVVVFCIFQFGIAQRWARNALLHQLEASTGARVELGGFHLHALRMRAELDNLTLHGLEKSSDAPLFQADRVQVGITVLSFLHRQFKIDELLLDGPQLTVRFEKNGSSNLPTPKTPPHAGPWQETLFNLRIGRVELRNGSASVNDRRVPLEVKGQNLAFRSCDEIRIAPRFIRAGRTNLESAALRTEFARGAVPLLARGLEFALSGTPFAGRRAENISRAAHAGPDRRFFR